MITQIKINGVIELDSEIDPELDYSICLERTGVKDGAYKSYINKNEVEVKTWKLENLGRVNIISEKKTLLKGKAKKLTKSQILRLKIEEKGLDYDKTMNIILDNWEQLASN